MNISMIKRLAFYKFSVVLKFFLLLGILTYIKSVIAIISL